MRLRQFADDSRLTLPINPDKAPKKPTTHSFHSDEAKAIRRWFTVNLPVNPDKAPKVDDSRLILPINPDKAQKPMIHG